MFPTTAATTASRYLMRKNHRNLQYYYPRGGFSRNFNAFNGKDEHSSGSTLSKSVIFSFNLPLSRSEKSSAALKQIIASSPKGLIERLEIYHHDDQLISWITTKNPLQFQQSLSSATTIPTASTVYQPVDFTHDYWKENFYLSSALKKYFIKEIEHFDPHHLLSLSPNTAVSANTNGGGSSGGGSGGSSGGGSGGAHSLQVIHERLMVPSLLEVAFLKSFYEYYEQTKNDVGLYRITLYREEKDPSHYLIQSVFHSSKFQEKHQQSPSFQQWKHALTKVNENYQKEHATTAFPPAIFFQKSSQLSLTSGEGANDFTLSAIKSVSSIHEATPSPSVAHFDTDAFSGWKGFSTAAPGLFSFLGPKILMGRNIAASAILSTFQSIKAVKPLIVTGKTGKARYDHLFQQIFTAKDFPNYQFSDHIWTIDGEPTVEDAIAVREFAVSRQCDSVLAIGGGSAVDLGKAIAALIPNAHRDIYDFLEVVGKGLPLEKTPLPFIAVPTTSGTGSEATKNAVLKSVQHERKVSIRNDKMYAVAAILDPILTLSCPPSVTAHVGMDTLCQVIEPYVCNAPTPFVDALSREGILRASRSLRNAVWNGQHDIEAREDMAIASVFSGLSLANARLGIVHGFAAVLGGMYEDAPHGAICATLLPHVFQKNVEGLNRIITSTSSSQKEKMEAIQRLNRFLEVSRMITNNPSATIEQGIDWLHVLLTDINIPPLSTLCKGMKKEDFQTIIPATLQASSSKGNPVKLTEQDLVDILTTAF